MPPAPPSARPGSTAICAAVAVNRPPAVTAQDGERLRRGKTGRPPGTRTLTRRAPSRSPLGTAPPSCEHRRHRPLEQPSAGGGGAGRLEPDGARGAERRPGAGSIGPGGTAATRAAMLLRRSLPGTLRSRYAGCGVPRFGRRRAVSRRSPLNSAARKGGLVLVLAVVILLAFGVPRWLESDAPPEGSNADTSFSKVCREHGGTPTAAPGSGTKTTAQRFCAVRYGRRVYRMDAITPHGFDEDTARFQRQGCKEADRHQRASTVPGHRRPSFVYHPATGVCEHSP